MPETIGKSSARQASRDAFDGADQLAHDLRLFRIAEIEIVGQRQRLCADHAEIAPRLRDRLFAALARVGVAIEFVDVGGQSQALRPFADADHRGIAARRLHRIAENEMVILLEDPAFRTAIRAADKPLQRLAVGNRRRDRLGESMGAACPPSRRADHKAAPGRRAP